MSSPHGAVFKSKLSVLSLGLNSNLTLPFSLVIILQLLSSSEYLEQPYI
jgi:hypothetical protein